MLSVLSSLLSLSWALASYSRTLRFSLPNKAKMTWSGTILQFLWHFFYITSRVLALSLFASVYPYYIFVFCFVHWCCMTMWIYVQKTDFCQKRWEEFFYNVIMGIVHIFVFFNVKDTRTRYKYVAYYTLTFIEGSLLIAICFIMSRLAFKVYWPVVIGFYGAFILGITFMCIYYAFYHPTLMSSVANNGDQTDGPSQENEVMLPKVRFGTQISQISKVSNEHELVHVKS